LAWGLRRRAEAIAWRGRQAVFRPRCLAPVPLGFGVSVTGAAINLHWHWFATLDGRAGRSGHGIDMCRAIGDMMPGR